MSLDSHNAQLAQDQFFSVLLAKMNSSLSATLGEIATTSTAMGVSVSDGIHKKLDFSVENFHPMGRQHPVILKAWLNCAQDPTSFELMQGEWSHQKTWLRDTFALSGTHYQYLTYELPKQNWQVASLYQIPDQQAEFICEIDSTFKTERGWLGPHEHHIMWALQLPTGTWWLVSRKPVDVLPVAKFHASMAMAFLNYTLHPDLTGKNNSRLMRLIDYVNKKIGPQFIRQGLNLSTTQASNLRHPAIQLSHRDNKSYACIPLSVLDSDIDFLIESLKQNDH